MRLLPLPLPSARAASGVLALCLIAAVSGCSKDSSGAASSDAIDVKAGDSSCQVADTDLDAGSHTFRIENTGSQVTEVYVYAKQGDDFSRIVTEKENIGPGTTQTVTVDLPAGAYQVACKPGMTGHGIRTALTVTGEGGASSSASTEAAYDRELEVEVAKDGSVEKPASLTAKAGERIEFKLENASPEEHYLEVLGPDGKELGEAEAQAGKTAEFVAQLKEAGDYSLKVFADGEEDKATTLPLKVTP
ncbi:MAG: cupredoxin domain-containing protein [Actinomycetales bacterium]